MTVIDLSVLTAFWLGGHAHEAAETLYRDSPDWAAPVGWRSDFRRILDHWVSFEQIDALAADQIWYAVASQLAGREFFSGSLDVLELVAIHGLGRFDAEVVAFARARGCRFHTTDVRLAERFPEQAVLVTNAAPRRTLRAIGKAA